MNSLFKYFIKQITPLGIYTLYNKISSIKKSQDFAHNVYKGNYATWEDALKESSGYASALILEKVKKAALKVRDGQAAYERDSILFNEIDYYWPLLAGLLRIATANNNRLNILDFGGSLGSTYFQNRKFLSVVDVLQWNIVEQENYVVFGKENFENDSLKFYKTIDNCLSNQKPDVILLSSVIQYIRKPYDLIDEIISRRFNYIIIDKTGFIEDGSDLITIQLVPPTIFDASIPLHVFNYNSFLKKFLDHYILINDFNCTTIKYVDTDDYINHKGLIFQLK